MRLQISLRKAWVAQGNQIVGIQVKMEVCERLADFLMAIAPNKLKKVNEELKMKHIKSLFAAAFMLFINMAHAQTAATTPATVALTPSPSIAPTVDNPYGLAAVWGQGDWVAKTTILLLIIMSLASWYVLISKLIAQNRMQAMAKDAERAFSKAANLQQGANAMAADSPYRFIVDASLDAVQQHPSVAGQVDLNTWAAQSIERSVATVQGNSQQGLAVLATVGSTAPFVGLFGTVWGIYNALVKIGASGQASIDKVAGPVGEALIMTAIGLAVAVPAVLGYNWLVRRNKVGMDGVRAFGSNLHTNLLVQADKTRNK
jgi:biopolymer transport protein ExbB